MTEFKKKTQGFTQKVKAFCVSLQCKNRKNAAEWGYKILSAAPCDTPNSAPQKVFGIRTYALNHYVDRAFV